MSVAHRDRLRGRPVALCAIATTLILALALVASPAASDTDLASKDALTAAQRDLYARLLERPDDPRLMFEYARISAQLENYEGAISTLERLLLFRPGDAGAQAELGALYFAIGSYAAAKLYFEQALSDPALSPDRRARIDEFLAEIERRTATHRYAGEVSLGLIYSTNASFGPDRDEFDAVDGGALRVSESETPDLGTRVRAALFHSYDLGGPTEDRWDTEADLDGRWYSDSGSLNFVSGAVRTGPRVSVDPRQAGLQLRPFVELGLFSADDRLTSSTAGGGLEARAALGDRWAASGELRAVWRAFAEAENEDFDGLELRALAAARYTPTRDLAFRLIALAEREDAEIAEGRSTAGGLQASVSLAYDSPLSVIDEKWRLDLNASAVYRRFDAPQEAVETGDRDQLDLTVGLTQRIQITDTVGVLAEIDYQVREASAEINEFDAITAGLSLSFRF